MNRVIIKIIAGAGFMFVSVSLNAPSRQIPQLY